MRRVLIFSFALFALAACGGNDDATTPTASQSNATIDKSSSLREGSAPIITAGDEDEPKPSKTETPDKSSSEDEQSLRVKAVLNWKRGEALPSAKAIAAAQANLANADYAASEEGIKLAENLKTIALLAKAAALKAHNAEAPVEAEKNPNALPAPPLYDRDKDHAESTMRQPDGDLEVKEAIEAVTAAEQTLPAQRDALMRASNATKLLAIAYACDLLIAGSNNENSEAEFEATANFLSEMVGDWKDLDDAWRKFLSFNSAANVPRDEMLWRYSQAWILLQGRFR